MRRFMIPVLWLPLVLGAADCGKLEADFAALDAQFRMARTIESPTARYDYYYRYISKGADLMVSCRNDRRNYKYAEIVRKLRAADREREGLRQSVIEEQWRVNNVQPIINVVYESCAY